MKPYANESEVIQIEGLTIENRIDRISIYGEIDITRDKLGLASLMEIKIVIDEALKVLEVDKAGEKLPEQVAIEASIRVDNPFV